MVDGKMVDGKMVDGRMEDGKMEDGGMVDGIIRYQNEIWQMIDDIMEDGRLEDCRMEDGRLGDGRLRDVRWKMEKMVDGITIIYTVITHRDITINITQRSKYSINKSSHQFSTDYR